jgi:hypothetical protein
MSWDIRLVGADGPCMVPHHAEGGTVAMEGTTEARLNVTYNYSAVTRLVQFHFRESLHGRMARDTLAELRRVCDELPDRPYRDYWAPTPGNAGHAAAVLLGWAELHPAATWEVD